MPMIRHTVSLPDNDLAFVAYVETPFGEGEWHPDQETDWADEAHYQWFRDNVTHDWELLYDTHR